MISWWQKSLLAAAALTGLTAGGYYILTQRPLPQKNGKVSLAGLHEPVEIITDHYGVPHIYAKNEDDLYFAQGYMHAQDRLWQLELNRRLGSGRLSEIFGEVALETDRFCRRLGMHRSAEEEVSRLTPHNKRVLNAYTLGINTFISKNSHKLPIEFTLLRLQTSTLETRRHHSMGQDDGLESGRQLGDRADTRPTNSKIRARACLTTGGRI